MDIKTVLMERMADPAGSNVRAQTVADIIKLYGFRSADRSMKKNERKEETESETAAILVFNDEQLRRALKNPSILLHKSLIPHY